MSAVAPSRWFRANLWLHRWASLLATPPFLVLCLTGTVLVFHEEVDAALGVVPVSTHREGARQRGIAESIDNVLAANPDERALSVWILPEEYPGLLLVVTGERDARTFDGAKLRFADLATAQPVGDPAAEEHLTDILLELHAQWFLGPAGELVGALIAFLVFLSLFSGIVVYAPYVRRVAFGALRRARGARLFQLDLHNFIGAVVLGWALVVTITGFLLGFSSLAIGVWQRTELGELHRNAASRARIDPTNPPVDVEHALAAATAAAEPGWQVATLVFPGTDFSTPRHYFALTKGTEGLDERLYRVTAIDAVTGEVALSKELPGYLKTIVLSEPLHFGDYGGLPLKLLWTACTWLTLYITANGAWLWWDRRRRSPRARAAEVPT